MRPRHWLFGLLVIVMVGLALAGGKSGQTAFAQQNRQQSANGRFQISAWTTEGVPQGRLGCYMVDTATGELWEMVFQEDRYKWVKKADRPH